MIWIDAIANRWRNWEADQDRGSRRLRTAEGAPDGRLLTKQEKTRPRGWRPNTGQPFQMNERSERRKTSSIDQVKVYWRTLSLRHIAIKDETGNPAKITNLILVATPKPLFKNPAMKTDQSETTSWTWVTSTHKSKINLWFQTRLHQVHHPYFLITTGSKRFYKFKAKTCKSLKLSKVKSEAVKSKNIWHSAICRWNIQRIRSLPMIHSILWKLIKQVRSFILDNSTLIMRSCNKLTRL